MKHRTIWVVVGAVSLAVVSWGIAREGRVGQGVAPAVTAAAPPPQARAVVSTPSRPRSVAKASLAATASQPQPHTSGDGELFTYSSTDTPHRDGPFTYYPIDVSVDDALASALTGHLTLTAPDGTQIQLDYDRHINHGDGNWTWIGRMHDGDIGQDAVITFGPDATAGTLPSANGQLLRITTIGGHTYMAAAPYSQLKRGVRAGGDTVVSAADGTVSVTAAESSLTATSVPATGVTVDVLAPFSSGYRAYRGSAAAATTAITNMIAVANQALLNTNITNVSFRLVGTLEVNYADNSDNSAALTDLAGGAAFVDVRNARARYGADLVSFVRHFTDDQNGCGLAYIPQVPYSLTGVNQTWSVVGDGTIDTGNGSYAYCPDESMAHEMGHNLGAQHNKQQSPTGGLYPWSYGYRNDSAAFYDVMAYGLDGQESELVYSSPDISVCKGLPCGIANSADVARTLRETMPVAAGFRATTVPGDNPLPGQMMLANGRGRCLDVANGSVANGAAIQMWACNGLRQQQWGEAPSTGALVNRDTTQVLDAVGNGKTNGTPLQLYAAFGTDNQAWRFTSASIVSASSGRVLDGVGNGTGNGTLFQLWDEARTPNQMWNFDPRNGRIESAFGRCLDVQGFGTANGTRVQLWDCTGAANQTFHIGQGGTIVGYGGNCLEVANGGTANGSQIRMWACNGGAHQKWRIRGEVRSVASTLCLDDPAGGTGNGVHAQLWTCLGNDHQRWEFQPN